MSDVELLSDPERDTIDAGVGREENTKLPGGKGRQDKADEGGTDGLVLAVNTDLQCEEAGNGGELLLT